jgi:hypothetical protein
MTFAPLLSGLVVLALAIGVLSAIRQRQGGRGPSLDTQGNAVLQRDSEGDFVVPVKATFKGGAHNSLYPALAITPEGLRFKVLGEGRWPFPEVARVIVARTLFGASLTFESRRDGTLVARVASLEVARQAVAALPAAIPVIDRTAKTAGA